MRAEQGRVDLASENRRLNGVEYLRFMELLPIPLIASVHGLQPVWPQLAGEIEFRFPPARFVHWLCVRAASRAILKMMRMWRREITAVAVLSTPVMIP